VHDGRATGGGTGRGGVGVGGGGREERRRRDNVVPRVKTEKKFCTY